MGKWILAVMAAVVLSAGPSMAAVGKTYLTAYDKTKGSQAKAAKFGTQIRLKLPSEIPKAKASKAAKKAKSRMLPNSYTVQVRYFGKPYYTTKRGKRWIAAHTKARHVLLVRHHLARGKYKIVCGTRPKGLARKPIRKKKAKPAGKSS